MLRAGRIPEAEEFIDHSQVRHVLKSLWRGSVEADGDPVTADWEQDLSWLGELDLAEFHWGTGSSFYVEITYRAQVIEVSLGFRVRPTDAGWVLTGPATYW
nr:hypothetical protein [Streptomyces sp. SID13726]